jgi:hypothetical protein
MLLLSKIDQVNIIIYIGELLQHVRIRTHKYTFIFHLENTI